ncbi:hypothetical protein AMS68_004890 [Peltaster fructicola]|uniref:Major facilitator superfamily (MFS) profile domain-containing protein n=1 Tax=Peltaster fructicola TaxID=286661 RepID=A0A6H0XX93_9PEZI|nr:hypothetical protein AMS68_004890 [Peltaster fructicola]
MSLIRDAPVGQLIRWITKNRVLRYPEEMPGFVLPPEYQNLDTIKPAQDTSSVKSSRSVASSDVEKEGLEDAEQPYRPAGELEASEHDLEKATTRQSMGGGSLAPTKTKDGHILIDFYSTDDPENPLNWSTTRKTVASLQIYIYTLAVYMGSAIYTPSVQGVQDEFGVGTVAASLGLALYVLAYGIGPILWSPLSEIPAIGRNPPYILTMGIFVALSVAAPLTPTFAGLLVTRFLQGFFGSPCLATGGASLSDLYDLAQLPYMICLWAFAATCGPALGPTISGFSVAAENWRWSLWEILWLGGPIFISMLFFLPETYAPNILLRKAQRLRKLTGNQNLKSKSEIDQANMSARSIAFEALVRPFALIILDPAIAYVTFYTALVYGIYYSFFEAFPIVYVERYGFSLGELGLAFLSIIVAVVIAIAIYYSYLHWVIDPDMKKNGPGLPERRLIPALFASILLPVGLFIFGWTGNGQIHWIISVIGIAIFTVGVFIVLQCIFVYLPWVYPQYAASLFAGNDFARSSLAFAAVLYGRPMYLGMGIGPGTSLLGGLTAACVLGLFGLYYYGAKLRARSKFSAKY